MSLLRKLFVCSRTQRVGRGAATDIGQEGEKARSRERQGEECAVCQDVLHEACTVPCGNHHIFCLACLKGVSMHSPHRNHFLCPLCRTRVRVPLGGVAAFRNNKTLGQKLRCKLPAVGQRRHHNRTTSTSADFVTVYLPVLAYPDDQDLDILYTAQRHERWIDVLLEGTGPPAHHRGSGTWVSDHTESEDDDDDSDDGPQSAVRVPSFRQEAVGADDLDMAVVLQIIADMEDSQTATTEASHPLAADPTWPRGPNTGSEGLHTADAAHSTTHSTEHANPEHRPASVGATHSPDTAAQTPDARESRGPESSATALDTLDIFSSASQTSETSRATPNSSVINTTAASLKPDSTVAPSEKLNTATDTCSDVPNTCSQKSQGNQPGSAGSSKVKTSECDNICSLSRASGLASAVSSSSAQPSAEVRGNDGHGGSSPTNAEFQHNPNRKESDLPGHSGVLNVMPSIVPSGVSRPRMGSYRLAIDAGQRTLPSYAEHSRLLVPSTPRHTQASLVQQSVGRHFAAPRQAGFQLPDPRNTEAQAPSSQITCRPSTEADAPAAQKTGHEDRLVGLMDSADRDEEQLIATMDNADRSREAAGKMQYTTVCCAPRNRHHMQTQEDPKLHKSCAKHSRTTQLVNGGPSMCRQSYPTRAMSQHAAQVRHGRPGWSKEQASSFPANIADGLQPEQKRLPDRSGGLKRASSPSISQQDTIRPQLTTSRVSRNPEVMSSREHPADPDSDDSEDWARSLRRAQRHVMSQTCRRQAWSRADAQWRGESCTRQSFIGTTCAEDRLHDVDSGAVVTQV